jgi:hypothetical protein
VHAVSGYRDMLLVAALSDTEVVVVERPWKEVLQHIKEKPAYKHQYIM